MVIYGCEGVRNMNLRKIVEDVLSHNITQQELGDYLEITRQTVSKIKNGEYVKLSRKTEEKLSHLENRTQYEIDSLIKLDQMLLEIRDRVIKGDSKYLTEAREGIGYMHYWLTDEKFLNKENYHTYYFGHMNNFYPRYNQAALFMRDTLNRQKYPLVTFQVDYEKKMITDFCIKAFVPEHENDRYKLEGVSLPISFERFLEELTNRIQPTLRFMVYRDYKDDEWDFILRNVKKHRIHEREIYDLSRLFNFLDNEQAYFGPLIENVLSQFRINYDLSKLLTDCYYRADKIVEVVNLVSLEELYRKKIDKSSRLFDSHGLKRDNEYMKKERRNLKKGY
jgi:transcriptional regulator with XRE-family HTH domain